jgi:tRNA G18 (ribose-2'-O)-methylase SpoU
MMTTAKTTPTITTVLVATTASFLLGAMTTFAFVNCSYYMAGNRNNQRQQKQQSLDHGVERQQQDVDDENDTNSINVTENTKFTGGNERHVEQVQQHDDNDFDNVNVDCRVLRKAETILLKRTSALCIVIERCTNDHNYSAIIRTAEALGIQHIYIIDKPLIVVDDEILATDVDESNGAVQTDNGILDKGKNYTKGKKKISGRSLTVDEIEARTKHRLFAQNATDWITIHEYKSTIECIQACRDAGYAIWVTDLSQCAVKLTKSDLQHKQQQQQQSLNVKQKQQYWPIPEKLAICMGTEAVGASAELLDNADVRCYIPLVGFADSLNLSVATAMVVQLLFVLQPNFLENMSSNERHELRKVWYPKLASQRLLTAREKKRYKHLQLLIQYCYTLKTKSTVTSEQQLKIENLNNYESEYATLQEKMNISTNVIQELINNPPKPFSDIRRCNDHRITFAGKNVKKLHKDDWSNNVGIQKVISPTYSTAQYFRTLNKNIVTTNNE